MGIETAVIPTAVLSTHTAFKNFTFKNLVKELEKIIKHWKEQDFTFDVIYIGYTGTEEILKFVLEFIDTFKTEKNIVVFDPAMADNGKIYTGISYKIIEKMKEVCKKADIIKPNLTESALLLGERYKEQYSLEEVRNIAKKLKLLGSANIVITGVEKDDKIGAIGFNGEKYYENFEHKYNAKYHGTGDIFTSALTGAIVQGRKMEEAIKIATKFTTEAVRLTYEDENEMQYGVKFEQALPYLIELLKKYQ